MSDPPRPAEGADATPPPVLRWGLAGALLLWLAQPPTGWWPLAWVATVPWIVLALSPAPLGRRGLWRLWLAGATYWLLTVHWVRLPHPLTPIGWLFLSAYLGLYPMAFVWLTRAALSRGAAVWLAAPVVWTGLELLQARLFGGFLMGALSHSQYGQIWLLPLARWGGAYAVSWVLVAVAAVGVGLFAGPARSRAWGLGFLGLVGALVPGVLLENPPPPAGSLRVAVIQGDTRATWDPDPERPRRIMDRQVALSLEATRRAGPGGLDLVVWPESMFRAPLDTFAGSTTPPGWADPEYARSSEHTHDWFRSLAPRVGAPLLVGLDRFDWPDPTGDQAARPWADVYNSAALIDPSGELLATYDKTHLVPFGEYIPLAKGMPALYFLTPMSGGMARGAGPVAMRLERSAGGPVVLSPSICYETVVPRVIRRHVAELTAAGAAPDLLVNVTNDAWFWGSSELDLHLACAVYRAVETGTPVVVAANGGLSAVIDASGRVLEVGPRMAEHVLIADAPLRAPGPPTPYVRWGDRFAGACLLACAVVALGEWRRLYGRKA